MRKRITYEIHGQIERNSYFRIGKALVRIDFTGGAINSTGIYPAQYTTDNPLFQRAIECSDAFRSGEIKRGRVEVLDNDNKDSATETEAENKCVVVTDVTNMQQARAYLMAEPYNCPLAQLQNKNSIKSVAKANSVSFPNWL
ncbi:MAG: hypothetical protein J6Q73_03755 [Bacteroidaceae bacterium]|nr:hypothetical protein [Bacteroidaceae bacterium]